MSPTATKGPDAAKPISLTSEGQETFTVVLMGRASVGKSALSLRYTEDRFAADYDPTIEDMHKKETTVDGAPLTLKILDTAGQENYSGLRRNWFERGSGFVFVFSLIDRQTFDELSSFQDELMDMYNDDPPPSVLLANKADIDEKDWVVEAEEIERLKDGWNGCVHVYYSSAMTGNNVNEAFQHLCRASRSYREEKNAAAEKRNGTAQAAAVPSTAALAYNDGPSFVEGENCNRCFRCGGREDGGGCTVL